MWKFTTEEEEMVSNLAAINKKEENKHLHLLSR